MLCSSQLRPRFNARCPATVPERAPGSVGGRARAHINASEGIQAHVPQLHGVRRLVSLLPGCAQAPAASAGTVQMRTLGLAVRHFLI